MKRMGGMIPGPCFVPLTPVICKRQCGNNKRYAIIKRQDQNKHKRQEKGCQSKTISTAAAAAVLVKKFPLVAFEAHKPAAVLPWAAIAALKRTARL